MTTTTVTVYGPGGYDPQAPNGNVVDEYTVDVPDATDPLEARLAVVEAKVDSIEVGPGSTATALIPLRVPTHDRKPGCGHPDVLHVAAGFGGYAYWMAYTPLPNTPREVPVVVASHDGIVWENPADPLAPPTPLVTYQDAIDAGYDWWADPDLVLTQEGVLELYWIAVEQGVRVDYVRSTSTDGVTWTDWEVVIANAGGASPAVVIEDDGTRTMFSVDGGLVKRRTSADGVTWSAAATCTIPTLPAPWNHPWHIDVTKVGGTYHALVNALGGAGPHRLFYWTSTDGVTFTGSVEPAVPLTGGYHDQRGHYRSTIQPAASGAPGKFDLWMSCIDGTRTTNHTAAIWRIGHIRDFDFTDGETWAFPEPPRLHSGNPVDGDELWIMAHDMRPHTGTPTEVNVNGSKMWALGVDDYLSLNFPPVPRTWHQIAVDLLLVNPTTNTGDVVFTSRWAWTGPGVPLGEGTPTSARSVAMPATQYDSVWLTLINGATTSAFDALHGTVLNVEIRRRGGPANTYGTTDKPLILAARMRRVES